jgi:MoaA/NifB/PqqE/SkfB family radical SAM enzyme
MKNFLTANTLYNQQSDYGKIAFEKNNLMPRRYVFVLTNLCNLRCTFCFQERKKRSDRMSTEDWLKVVNQIPRNSRITLTGGEPLVYKDFDMIFAKANESSETNIITNGLLLDDRKIELLVNQKNFKILGVSIDTIGNVNRDFKKTQWEDLVSRLNKFIYLRDKKNHTSALDIKTVILDENIEDLFLIHKFAVENLKADTHSFSMLKGASIQHSDLMFDFKQIDTDYEAHQYKKFNQLVRQLNLIKEYDYKNGYKSYLHPNLVNLGDNKKIKEEDLTYLNNKKHNPNYFATCHAPWSSVHINVDGSLFPCMAVSMGNVKKKELSKIIFSEEFKKFKDIIKEKGTINGCNRCGWLKQKEN